MIKKDSVVSIDGFEQVNVSWDRLILCIEVYKIYH